MDRDYHGYCGSKNISVVLTWVLRWVFGCSVCVCKVKLRDSLLVCIAACPQKQAKSTLSRLSTMFGALKNLGLEVS